jgi:RNA polymerase sigma-70 factor (ECF subfamily)
LESERSEAIVQLLTDYQQRLYVYILSLVGNPTDADEILQNTNLTIWRKAHEFQFGTSFSAWACRMAYYEVLAFRKQRGRSRLSFDQELLETLATEAAERAETFDARRRALAKCLQKLSQRDRDLVVGRYKSGGSVAALAAEIGRTVQAVYQALHRVRSALLLCVRRTMAIEERA